MRKSCAPFPTVKTFKTQIGDDCIDLTDAMKRLQMSVDSYTVASMVDVVNRIDKILSNADPALRDLGKRVDDYADFVDRLKQIANQT